MDRSRCLRIYGQLMSRRRIMVPYGVGLKR
jgi:hypothetical protein